MLPAAHYGYDLFPSYYCLSRKREISSPPGYCHVGIPMHHRLRTLRTQHGLTLKQISERTGHIALTFSRTAFPRLGFR